MSYAEQVTVRILVVEKASHTVPHYTPRALSVMEHSTHTREVRTEILLAIESQSLCFSVHTLCLTIHHGLQAGWVGGWVDGSLVAIRNGKRGLQRSLSCGGITDRSANPTHLGAEGTSVFWKRSYRQSTPPWLASAKDDSCLGGSCMALDDSSPCVRWLRDDESSGDSPLHQAVP